jgi:hypothetical protein
LLVGLYGGMIFGWIKPDTEQLGQAWLFGLVVFVGLAYLAGLLLFKPSRFWSQLFRERNLARTTLEEVHRMWPQAELRLTDKEWPLVMAFLKQANPERAAEIERNNAINLMLRSTSFSLLVLALIQGAYFLAVSPVFWNLVFAFAFLGLSVLAGRQSTVFSRMYYTQTYLAVLALGMKVEQVVEPTPQASPTPQPPPSSLGTTPP